MTMPLPSTSAADFVQLGATRSGLASSWRDLWGGDAAFSFAVALLLPLGLYLTGLSALNRTLYPAIAFGAAGLLYARRSPWYVGLCIWLFAVSPLIRRLTDFQLGFEPASTVLLAPYVACLWAGLSAVSYCLGPRPRFAGAFVLMLCCILYAFAVSVLGGLMLIGAVEALKWTVGPLVALHIMACPELRPAFRRVVVAAFVSAGLCMSIYGVAQFISPPPWDVHWVDNMRLLGMGSTGTSDPFGIRVFATMHSAGSLGAFLTAVVVYILALPAGLALPSLMPVMLAIGLCQYRAVWAGTLVAVACMALLGPTRVRIRIFLCAGAVAFSLGALSILPEVEHVLEDRLRSLTELQGDASGEERLQMYVRFLIHENEELLLGTGIATGSGSLVEAVRGGPGNVEGGFLVCFVALGMPVALIYLGALGLVAFHVFAATNRLPGEGHIYSALVVGWLMQLPFGSVQIGELGFPGWIAVGLALAASTDRSG